jgi:tetratricopeptide (TPR) repeat protein
VAGDNAAALKVFAPALRAHQDGRLAEAIQGYLQAIQLDPAYYNAHYNLGLAEAAAGQNRQALGEYELALAIKPDSADARYNFALLLKQTNDPYDAADELERLLGFHPDESRAHLALGNIYAQQLRQPAKAREHYLKALETDPHNPQATAIQEWLASHPR